MAEIDTFDNGMTEEEMAELNGENAQPVNPEPTKIEEEEKDDTVEDNTTKPEMAEEKETPPASSTEQKTDEEKETGSDPENTPDENKLPFHKHPRWIAQRKKEEFLETQLAETNAKLEELQKQIKPAAELATDPVAIPEWFTELYGSDDPEKDQAVYQKYLKAQEAEEEDRYKRFRERLDRETTEASEREKEDLEWVDSQIAHVRESLEEGQPDFDNNALLKIVWDYKPMKEEDGVLVPDFMAAYNILINMKSTSESPAPKPKDPAVEQKKKLAAHPTTASGESQTEGAIASNETLALDPPW